MDIPDTLLTLPWVEVNIYIYLRRKAGTAAFCEAPLSELAAEFSITRPTANRHIHQLEKMGYFTIGKQTFYNNGQMRYKNFTVISFKPSKLAPASVQHVNNSVQNVDKSVQSHNNTSTVAERRNRFASDLQPYLEKYGRDMLNAFFLYWTQTCNGSSKMLYEKQKSFQLPNRLALWHRREKEAAAKTAADGFVLHDGQMNVNHGGW